MAAASSSSRALPWIVEKANSSADVAKRVLKVTGKVAWIAATTFIVLGIPLMIEIDREAQIMEDIHFPSLIAPAI